MAADLEVSFLKAANLEVYVEVNLEVLIFYSGKFGGICAGKFRGKNCLNLSSSRGKIRKLCTQFASC